MKRILFIGAGPFTLGAIGAARARGLEVLTTDNVPGNPGHRLADACFEVNALDIDGIEKLARARRIDAVIGYASEVCAMSAAIVAERLDLPGPGSEGARRLSMKDSYRDWTSRDGIQPIEHAVFDAAGAREAARWAANLSRPVVVKPADNSGSRGVSLVPASGEFTPAFERAAAASRRGRVLVEEWLERVGPQICGDGFVEDGELVFAGFGANRSLPDGEPAIVLEQYPPPHEPEDLDKVRRRLASIVAASGFQRGPVNFDAVIRPDGEAHVFEIGIRSGGNLIPDALSLTSGIDLVGAAVDCAVEPRFRLPSPPAAPPDAHPLTYVAHSTRPGTFRNLRISDEIRGALVDELRFREPGDRVEAFRSSADTVAVLLLNFESRDAMLHAADRMEELCAVELEPDS